MASFSYEISTSPLPLENVWSESRALLSCTTTFLSSAARNAWAWAGVLPCAIWLPYAAMMFQRAPPEVNGLGVTIFTPGLTRSFQPVMCFGLPLRTASATTESVTIPLCGPASQLEGIVTDSDRKSTRLNSSHDQISYAVFCLKKKKKHQHTSGPTSRPV